MVRLCLGEGTQPGLGFSSGHCWFIHSFIYPSIHSLTHHPLPHIHPDHPFH